ncbi:MAG: hypothetical protein QOK27_2783 [Gemmatimonadales bacterium]|nr:hypothetical protein [Gemmatimonadales bacterium]
MPHSRIPNDLPKFPVGRTSFEPSVKFGLMPAKPVVEPWVGGRRARDEISAVELTQVSCCQPELLEWPAACVDVLQVFQSEPHRRIVFIDID